MKNILKKPVVIFAFKYLLLAIGLFSALYIFLGLFSFPHIPVIISLSFFYTVVFTILLGIIPKKMRILFWLLFLGAWLLTGYYIIETLWEGALVSAGYITPDLSRLIKYEFPAPPLPSPEQEWSCAILWIYLMLPYTAVFTWAMLYREKRLLSLLMNAPFFGFAYSLCGVPENFVMIMQVVFWLTLLMQMRWLHRRRLKDAGIPLLCMLTSAAAITVILVLSPSQGYEAPAKVYETRLDIMDAFVNLEYSIRGFGGFSGGAPLTSSSGNINLNQVGTLRFPDRDVLRVRNDAKDNLYLRGYAASVYTGNAWEQADPTVFEESGVDLSPLTFQEQGMDDPGIQRRSTVSVEILSDNSRYLFLPYFLAGIPAQYLPFDWVGDAYVAGQEQLSYTADRFVYNGIHLPVSGDWSMYSHNVMTMVFIADDIQTFEFNGESLPYDKSNIGPSFSNEVSAESRRNAYEYLENPPPDLDTITMFYPEFQSDFAYMKYIEDEYTQLPDGLQETLLAWWADQEERSQVPYSENTPYWNWVATAQLVSQRIADSGVYTTNPGVQPRNRDFVEYFLTEKNEGYCVHFASATTAMLRAMGIPARYVEGYVVTEENYGNDSWALVPADAAHAWAEIWMPSYGWIPVESTPGGISPVQVQNQPGAQNQEEEAEPGAEEETAPEEESESPSEEADEDAEETETAATTAPANHETGPDEGGGMSGAEVIRLAVYLILIAIVVSALICFIRLMIRNCWNRRFSLDDKNQAVLYHYMYLKRFAANGFLISEMAARVAQKAKFSAVEIAEAELAVLQKELQECRKMLREQPWSVNKVMLWLRGDV